MAVTGVTTTANTSAATTAANQREKDNNLASQDIFLKLLVAQMKYQDPMKPQDPTQQTTQLAQFNMVDEQNKTNTLLSELKAAMQGNDKTSQMIPYLGHQVQYEGSTIQFDGTASKGVSIAFPDGISEGTVAVADSMGNVVKILHSGKTLPGQMDFTWDGANEFGVKENPGSYQLIVEGINAYGDAVQPKPYITGTVTSIRNGANGQEMVIDGQAVASVNITEIK